MTIDYGMMRADYNDVMKPFRWIVDNTEMCGKTNILTSKIIGLNCVFTQFFDKDFYTFTDDFFDEISKWSDSTFDELFTQLDKTVGETETFWSRKYEKAWFEHYNHFIQELRLYKEERKSM